MSLETELKPSLYETDYQLWLDKTLEQLRSHDFSNIDLENLMEELEDLGKSSKRLISSSDNFSYKACIEKPPSLESHFLMACRGL